VLRFTVEELLLLLLVRFTWELLELFLLLLLTWVPLDFVEPELLRLTCELLDLEEDVLELLRFTCEEVVFDEPLPLRRT
jgi:hypothetical protein